MAKTRLKANQVNEDTLQDADNDTKVMVEESADEDKIRFDTAGSERMIIDESGKVGIGVASPLSPLHVYGNLDGTYVAAIDNDQNSNGHVMKLSTDGNGAGSRVLEMENSGGVIFRARADGRFGFGPDGVDSMGAGTFVVGIDNSSHTSDIAISKRMQHLGDADTYIEFPANDKINLVAGGYSFLKFEDNTIKINNANQDHDLRIMADDGNVILHADAGTNRVGIGTTSPAETLDINGIAKATSLRTGQIEYTDGDDAITIEDGGYLKFHAGVKYSRGVQVSSSVSPAGDSNPNKDGGWIKFASATPSGLSNVDVTASSFLITLAGTESSTNRRLDGTFLVHAKYTNNNNGNGDGNAGQYYEQEGTFIYCEPLNADWLSATGGHSPLDFNPTTDLLMIFTDTDTTPVVDLYIKACAKEKHCFVTHLGGTGTIDGTATDPGFSINTGQSYSVTEPAAPGGSVKKTGTWASKVFSNATVTSVLAVNEMLDTKAMTVNVRDVNSTSSVQAIDYVLRCVQNQAITITLPPKATSAGRVLIFKDTMGNANSNNITLDGDSSDTIDGSATYVISHNKEAVTLTCDGINGWMLTSRVRP